MEYTERTIPSGFYRVEFVAARASNAMKQGVLRESILPARDGKKGTFGF